MLDAAPVQFATLDGLRAHVATAHDNAQLDSVTVEVRAVISFSHSILLQVIVRPIIHREQPTHTVSEEEKPIKLEPMDEQWPKPLPSLPNVKINPDDCEEFEGGNQSDSDYKLDEDEEDDEDSDSSGGIDVKPKQKTHTEKKR